MSTHYVISKDFESRFEFPVYWIISELKYCITLLLLKSLAYQTGHAKVQVLVTNVGKAADQAMLEAQACQPLANLMMHYRQQNLVHF